MKTALLRCCSLPPHPQPIEVHEVPLRRTGRLMGDELELGHGGLYEAFLRRGDELVYFGDVADWLTAAVPGLGRDAVVTRFQLSARYGEFGRRGRLEKMGELIDLDDFPLPPRGAPPACYSLRPSYRAVTDRRRCETLRACKSTWARWLQAQSWPVPGWLAGAPVIEGEAMNVTATLLLAPTRANRGGRPPSVTDQVELWWKALPEDQKRLGAGKLAESYQAEALPGSFDHVRKLIAELQRRKGEKPVKT